MAQRVPAPMREMEHRCALLGRTARSEDIADQIVALCRSDSVTGQVLPVDCGLFLH